LLGCNGGIGGSHRQTTCYLLGESTIIDSGTGLTLLDLPQLACIDNVILTHAHFDHIACLPLLIDSAASLRNEPIKVWGPAEVIEILETHIFNDMIWPDFTKIPSESAPFMKLDAISERMEIAGMTFTPLAASHGIPACGYLVEKDGQSIAFSGDTEDCPLFWQSVSQNRSIQAVIIECSYPSTMSEMAKISMHMDVPTVASRVNELPKDISVVIVHRKPGWESVIEEELRERLPNRELVFPEPGDVLIFG
jgi:3',5'-cyclic-nucleotide phosphodiesterase